MHIHVNEPAEVFRVASEFGAVSGEKADDMQRQQHSAHSQDRRVAIATDSAADIPDEELDRLDIHMVPARVHFGERSYLDKVGITSTEFYDEIARANHFYENELDDMMHSVDNYLDMRLSPDCPIK